MKKKDKAVILIVDDKPANILVLEQLLASKERLLFNATNGKDALQITLNKNIDLVILDVQMPEMDGFEVAQIMKSNKRTKDIPIIFATAENKEHKYIMKGYDEGAIDYFFKPLDPEIVKAKVAVLLKIQLQKKELLEKNISLQKSELLINNSADIIGIIDTSTFRVEEINHAFTTILGYTIEETKETPLTFFLSNEDRLMVQELSRLHKEQLSFETRIYCKDRTIKWLQWNVVSRYGKWFVNARDITEIKEVEKIRNYIATVVKQSSDAVYILDREGKIISWNSGAEKIYGYSEGEALKMKIWNIIPGYMQPEMNEIVNRIIGGERIHDLESQRITKHGRLIDILFSASLITESGTHQVSVAITERDITLQKIAAEQIKESEARFRNLFEYAPFPMWVYDLNDLAFLEVNRVCTSLYGYSKDEFLTMKITDIRPKEEVKKLIEHIRQRTLQVESSGGWKHRLRNGKIIEVEVVSHLLDYKNHKAALVIATDVTEQKKADREIRQLNEDLQKNILQLKEKEEQVQTIFRYAPDAVIVIDEEGKITSWNPRAEAIFGWSVREVIGKELHETIIPQKFRKAHQKGLKHFLKTGEGPVLNKPLELSALKKDNTEFDAGISISPTILKGKKYFIGFVSDISFRKESERKIEQANKDLGKTVQQLNQANRELESFSYSVSHDLRAPLRAINGYAKIVQEEYYINFDDELKRLFSTIKESAVKMGVLIDDLLDFSRLGRREVKKSPVAIDEIIKEAWKQLTSSGKINVQLSVHQLCPSEGDRALLLQVFSNLISNAIKYSSKKPGPIIEIGSSENEDEYIYYVKDNGAGFNMEYADKLFGVFQRLHSEEEFEGTGVGLAIVQRIIAKHGGRVWAEGQQGVGATFYFSLPKP